MIKIEISVDTKKVEDKTGLKMRCEVFEGHDGYVPKMEKFVIAELVPLVKSAVDSVGRNFRFMDEAIGKLKEDA